MFEVDNTSLIPFRIFIKQLYGTYCVIHVFDLIHVFEYKINFK